MTEVQILQPKDIGFGLTISDDPKEIQIKPSDIVDNQTTFTDDKTLTSSTGFGIVNNLNLLGSTVEETVWLRTRGVKSVKLGFSHPASKANKFVGFPSNVQKANGMWEPKLDSAKDYHPLLATSDPNARSNGERTVSVYWQGILSVSDRGILLTVYTTNNLRLTAVWQFAANADQAFFCKNPFEASEQCKTSDKLIDRFVGWIVEDMSAFQSTDNRSLRSQHKIQGSDKTIPELHVNADSLEVGTFEKVGITYKDTVELSLYSLRNQLAHTYNSETAKSFDDVPFDKYPNLKSLYLPNLEVFEPEKLPKKVRNVYVPNAVIAANKAKLDALKDGRYYFARGALDAFLAPAVISGTENRRDWYHNWAVTWKDRNLFLDYEG